ncbi:MAG: flagellin lysine-N-methylase [Butyricicoccus pullicaecorum]|nr:flagellin lysine-N-methylase [Butyricicoccus pullicaecorum]
MPIKKYPVTRPTCYDRFQCKGGACRNTCCQGWTITISRAEYNKVRHLLRHDDVQFLKRLPRQTANDLIYATVQMTEDKYCPLFDSEGLCGLQRKYGYGALPSICKFFPRLMMRFSDGSLFRSLDSGCEKVLELLWEEQEEGLSFITNEIDITDLPASGIHQYPLYEYAADLRNLSIWLLKNRSYSLADRMILLGLAMRELQEISELEHPDAQVSSWFVKWQEQTKDSTTDLSDLTGNRTWFMMDNLKILYLFQIVLSKKGYYLSRIRENISFEIIENKNIYYDIEQYEALEKQFTERFPQFDLFFENFMVMTLFRLAFPFNEKSIWRSYLYLCATYSLMRFVTIASAPHNAQELIDHMTALSRDSLNMNLFSNFTAGELSVRSSDSLAHMVILIRG